MALDTACSSSLVALHTACKSLQTGGCNLALAGGVNLIMNPDVTVGFGNARILAKDSHCKTFDASADGYVRSEGCGVVVLKPLSDAIRDRDRIIGIIRASEVNQDGASSGLTVPNGEAQSQLIRHALEQARLKPNAIDYIETHGTGTPLGDPIEVGALGSVFGGQRDHPLWIGTVKTNVGHLEAAAGMAGLIKVLLSLNQEAIPPHIHFHQLNPNISLDSIPAKIPLKLESWTRSKLPRIAGVSAFGFSGTNAHVIVEEPPLIEHQKNEVDRPWHLLTLSAKTQPALVQLINLYKDHLPNEDLSDITFTANTGRAHFGHRMAVLARTRKELLEQLRAGDYLTGRSPAKPPKIAFLFTGQHFDSKELIETSPIFKEAMERSRGLYEYALAELWKSWGIIPDYVIGEGIGDAIAAIVAGIITLEEGLKLIDSQEMKIAYREPKMGFISSWTGEVIGKEILTNEYWKPHTNIRNIPESIILSAQNNWRDLLQILSQLYLNGCDVNWQAFDRPYNRKKVTLPTYPFQRESYWVESLKIRKKRHLPPKAHPLLGEYIFSPSDEKLFRNEIDLDYLPYLQDHQVFNNVLFPVLAS